MTSTTAYVSKARAPARPYVAEKEGLELIRLPKTDRTITGAGGMFTTAADVARFVRASLHGGRIDGNQAIPEAAVRLQQAPRAVLDATFTYYHRTGYGLGLYLATYDNEQMLHHFGSIGGYRAHMSWLPRHDVGVVVLQNEGGDGSRFADLVASYAYDSLLGRVDADERARSRIAEYRTGIERARAQRDAWRAELRKFKAGPATPTLPLAAYTGRFHNERLGAIDVRALTDRLLVSFGDASGEAIPVGSHDFLIDWNPGDQPDRWTFDTTDGRVVGFHWGQRIFLRSPPPVR